VEASALRAPAGLGRLSLPSALLKLRSDEQLVALFRAGNEDAFNVIHDRYRQRLFAYVRQMLAGSRSDAEDALQDVFLRAYNALRADDRPLALKAWLYRVAHNRCIDQLRRPIPAPSEIFEMSRPLMPDPPAETERRDDLRKLVADVQRLPEQQRSALLMRELEGLTYADLAEALDVSVPAVKSLLVRARIGLVEAAEARDTDCSDIRGDLALSFGKGVRASAKARRHMRECDGCREYRTQLRGVKTELNALLPGPGPLAVVAKLFGVGAGASSGGAAVVGGGAAAGFTAKVAAIVCCAAVVGGGAVELRHQTGGGTSTATREARPAAGTPDRESVAPERLIGPAPIAARHSAPAAGLGAALVRRRQAAAVAAQRRLRRERAASAAAAKDDAITPHFRSAAPATAAGAATATESTGGSAGPAEQTEPAAPSSTATAEDGSPTAAVTDAVTEPTASAASSDGSASSSETSTSDESGTSGEGTTTTSSGDTSGTSAPPPSRRRR
jgi:RNA polymerase sigma factor (sigma-70 family)